MKAPSDGPVLLIKTPRRHTKFLGVPFPRERARACLEALSVAAHFDDRHAGQMGRIVLVVDRAMRVESVTDDSPLRQSGGRRALGGFRKKGDTVPVHANVLQEGVGGFQCRAALNVTGEGVEVAIERHGASDISVAYTADDRITRIPSEHLAAVFLSTLSVDELEPHWDWFVENAPESLLDAAAGVLEVFGTDVEPPSLPGRVLVRLLEHESRTVRQRAIVERTVIESGPGRASTPRTSTR